MRIRTAIFAVCGGLAVAIAGCEKDDSTAEAPAPPATQPVEVASPGAAPMYGQPSGMGFSTGDAIHTDGQGSGMAGYHGTGATGTLGTITDTHPAPAPTTQATPPVLPPA